VTGKELEATGHYTPQLARKILQAVKEGSEIAAPTWSQVAEKVFATAEEHTDDLSLTQQERAAWNDLSAKQQEILQKEAMKIHLNTSHQAPRVLATNLRQAGAKLTSVAAMKLLKCDTCLEEKDPLPRPPANIQEPESRVPWEILGMDVKEVVEPRLDERIRYLVMVDEVSKFSRFVELFTTPLGQSRNATEAEVLKAYEDGWSTIFGDPRIIRHDEEGALKGNKFLETLAGRNIKLDVIAGEAHWQLGVTERMIGTIMRVAEKCAVKLVVQCVKLFGEQWQLTTLSKMLTGTRLRNGHSGNNPIGMGTSGDLSLKRKCL